MTLEDIKQKFICWINTQKVRKYTTNNCVDCLSRVSDYAVAHSISKVEFWQILDYKDFNRIRVALSANKIFKFSHPSLYHNFDRIGQLYSLFLKENYDVCKRDVSQVNFKNITDINEGKIIKAELSTIQNQSESSTVNKDVTCSRQDKEAIYKFFNDDIDTANRFVELYEYQRKTCPDILLDVRSTIIGAKLEGERLRFYVDNQCRISFSKLKIEDRRYIKPFTDSLLPEFYKAVDETNKYFIAHPDDVKLYATFEAEQKYNEPTNILLLEFSKVLEESFKNGLKLGNVLVRKRFFIIYEGMFCKTINFCESEFENLLYQIGFYYNNLIFPPSILTEYKKNQILSYINKSLNSGAVIYYSALYEIFKDILNGYIYDYIMLKSYLNFVNNQEFFCGEEYISLNKNVKCDLKKEIIEIFINAGKPLTYDELYAKLPNIDKAQINIILRDREFITNYKGSSCFYSGIFYCSEEDIAEIKQFLRRRINENGATSGAELFSFIKSNLPDMYETNYEITELGFRNALRLQLEDEFDFKGDVISLDGQKIDKTDLVKNFCSERESFTFEELYEFRSKINGQSYFDVVFLYAVRVNENQFIRKDKILFETEKVDAAIESFFETDYLPIEDVIYFTHFPTMDFPWNEYLLESFVYAYSEKFTLFHKSFNQSIATGAIVRKHSSIRTFEDLLIKVLQDNKVNGEIMTVDAAFDFLREHKYISVRRAKDLEQIIVKAKREQ